MSAMLAGVLAHHIETVNRLCAERDAALADLAAARAEVADAWNGRDFWLETATAARAEVTSLGERLAMREAANDVVAERWAFGDDSAAQLIARAAWPFDSQVTDWAPRMVTDRELFDRTRAEAEARITSAVAHVRAVLAGDQEGPGGGPGLAATEGASSGRAPSPTAVNLTADNAPKPRETRP